MVLTGRVYFIRSIAFIQDTTVGTRYYPIDMPSPDAACMQLNTTVVVVNPTG